MCEADLYQLKVLDVNSHTSDQTLKVRIKFMKCAKMDFRKMID